MLKKIFVLLILLVAFSAQAQTQTVVVVGVPAGGEPPAIPDATSNWLLNNNLTDVRGAHDGTSSSMQYATTMVEGTHAGQFSPGHYYYVSDHSDFDPGAGSWSCSFWMRTAWLGETQVIISKLEWSDGKHGYEIRFEDSDSDQLRLIIHIAGSATTIDTNWAPTVDTWYHVAVAVDPSAANEVVFWISSTSAFGDQVNGTAYNCDADAPDSAAAFAVGYQGVDSLAFYGYIDDVRWWKGTALNATQAQALYDLY